MSPRPGPPREPVNVRVLPTVREALTRRASEDTGGNESEMIRRLLAYAMAHMPRGWAP